MRFEREATDEDDQPSRDPRNRWYFFIPLPLVGLWLVTGAAQLAVSLLVPVSLSGGSRGPVDGVHDAIAAMEWLGGLGWLLLFPFCLVVLAHKRASPWWALGAFCCGLNLFLNIALLFLPARRGRMIAPRPPELLPLAAEELPRPSASLLQDSFVCESCNSLLNHGVSECPECGQRYQYTDGRPVADDATLRRGG